MVGQSRAACKVALNAYHPACNGLSVLQPAADKTLSCLETTKSRLKSSDTATIQVLKARPSLEVYGIAQPIG